MEIYKNFSPG